MSNYRNMGEYPSVGTKGHIDHTSRGHCGTVGIIDDGKQVSEFLTKFFENERKQRPRILVDCDTKQGREVAERLADQYNVVCCTGESLNLAMTSIMNQDDCDERERGITIICKSPEREQRPAIRYALDEMIAGLVVPLENHYDFSDMMKTDIAPHDHWNHNKKYKNNRGRKGRHK